MCVGFDHLRRSCRISHNLRPCCVSRCLEVKQRAAEKWKDVDMATRSLRLCVISNMLKVECCVNGAHSMNEVGLGAFGQYKTLPGLDCTFPGFVHYRAATFFNYLFIFLSVVSPYACSKELLHSVLLNVLMNSMFQCTGSLLDTGLKIVLFHVQWL